MTRAPSLLAVLLLLAGPLSAAVQLASPFTDHMVLQREMPVPIWGTADAGESITVEFAGQKKSTTADATGRWRVDLDPLTASAEPRELIVTSATPKSAVSDLKSAISDLRLSDVLVGEVWLASGQSNMDFTVSKSARKWAGVVNEEQEIAAANHPLVRMFTGGTQMAYTPQVTLPGEWKVCSPETVSDFSALGYFFARDLQRELQVPVGILTLSYGASCAHAWIRRDAMLADPDFRAVLDRFDTQVKGRVPPTEAELKDWEAAAELAKAELRRPPPKPGADPVQDQHNPTVMFNGMIAPVVPYALRGVLWYQGESITSPRELFPRWNALLITDWRALWGRELTFLFCQLAALDGKGNIPEVRAWQAEALKLPGTGMAVTIDVGDETNVHPKDKAPVGDRLMRLALAHAYGRALESSGPVFVSSFIEGAALRLRFSHLGGGLVAKGGPLQTFELAGADGKFVPAEAVIEGDTVVVRSTAVPTPVAARYAWSNYPIGCNLFNAAGLPAAPFVATPKP